MGQNRVNARSAIVILFGLARRTARKSRKYHHFTVQQVRSALRLGAGRDFLGRGQVETTQAFHAHGHDVLHKSTRDVGSENLLRYRFRCLAHPVVIFARRGQRRLELRCGVHRQQGRHGQSQHTHHGILTRGGAQIDLQASPVVLGSFQKEYEEAK